MPGSGTPALYVRPEARHYKLPSRKNVLNRLARDSGKPRIQPLELHRELRVFDSKSTVRVKAGGSLDTSTPAAASITPGNNNTQSHHWKLFVDTGGM